MASLNVLCVKLPNGHSYFILCQIAILYTETYGNFLVFSKLV